MKRIVAVIFEDGTEATVADMQTIVRYVNSFSLKQSINALASDHAVDWKAHGKAMDLWRANRLEKKAKKSRDAAKPRGKAKGVSPEKARATLERIVAHSGNQKWGSSKEAARELGISERTLNRRINKTRT
jgi:DNA-binding NtrC family response regulator